MYRVVLAVSFLLSFALPVVAGPGLGMTGAELRLTADDDGRLEAGALVTDTAVTEYHGLQLDFALGDTGGGTKGTAALHAYMTPAEGQKYGLFASVTDFDGRSATYGALGAEGRFALSPETALELRGGLGVTHRTGFDFLFASADLSRDLTPSLTASAGLTLAEYDEAGFSAIGHEARLGLRYAPKGSRFGAFAELARDGLSGDSGAPAETVLRVGVTLSLGRTQTGGIETRPFRPVDPLRNLVRRGLF